MAAVFVLIMFLAAALAYALLRRRRSAKGDVPASKPAVPMSDPTAPPGIFLDRRHAWARLATDGSVRVGIDAFLAGVLGEAEDVEAPPRGKRIRRGETLFRIRAGGRRLAVPAPVDGEVVRAHGDVLSRPWVVTMDPYGTGWVVALRCTEMKASLADLETGPSATAYLRRELDRWIEFLSTGARVGGRPVMADGAMPVRGAAVGLNDEAWQRFVERFVPAADESAPRD